MQATISKQELLKVLSITQNIVEKKSTMPILTNFLISVSNDKLSITASDLEITAVASVKANVTKPGSTTVSSKIFSDIVRELPDGDVEFKLGKNERLEIKSDNTKLSIIGVSSEEYPSLPGINFKTKGKISATQLLEMINKTIYAVSSDETRYVLNGVSFNFNKNKGKQNLNLVATDGNRLAMISRPLEDLDIEEKVIVPSKGLLDLRKILDIAGDETIGIAIEEGFLVVEAGFAKMSMRLIDGEYPDYKQVIPAESKETVVIETAPLAKALKRVSLMVADKSKCVKFDFSSGNLRISSSSPELGDATDNLPVDYKSDLLSVGFNANYVIDIANGIGESQKIKLELNGPLGAGKFYPENDESYVSVVMPMRLTSAA